MLGLCPVCGYTNVLTGCEFLRSLVSRAGYIKPSFLEKCGAKGDT